MDVKRCLAIVGIALLLLGLSCAPTIITSLEAEADWTAPLTSLQVTCTASSSSGGELSYQWSTNGGEITGAGPEVAWIAPNEVGMYDVEVVVVDSGDGRDSASIVLIASNGPPPVIEGLVITAEHEYLKETTTEYKVAKTYDYSIECVASNTSGELVYEWSCDEGEIAGEGHQVTWTAPDSEGEVTVTARVFDDAGNWVEKSIVLDVVRCTGCVNW
jgi:hypothetical protein